MAVPSRAYVGILTFALLASLAILPYTVLILSGYQPPPEAPHELLFPQPQESEPGTKVVLVLASLFCFGLVFVSWRGLLGVARRDAQARRDQARAPAGATTESSAVAQPTAPIVDDDPPGYQ